MIKRKTTPAAEGQAAPVLACPASIDPAHMGTPQHAGQEIPRLGRVFEPTSTHPPQAQNSTTTAGKGTQGVAIDDPHEAERGPAIATHGAVGGGGEQPPINHGGADFTPLDRVPGVPGYLAAVTMPAASRWDMAAAAGNHVALLDGLRAELTATLQVRWGCRRARVDNTYRIVGTVNVTPETQADWDADHLAADLAWLDFLRRCWCKASAAGQYLVRVDLDARIANWVELLTPQVEALAAELVKLAGRIQKAHALDAAGGWADEKTAPYLAIVARLAQLHELLDYHAPALVPTGLLVEPDALEVAA